MADIELVIKIPEEVKNRLCFGVTYPKDIQVICEALNNGILLPKGHGRLFDERDIVNGNYEIIGNKIYEVEPIIEADKTGGEGEDDCNKTF